MKNLQVVFVMALVLVAVSACALLGSQVTVGESERGVVADDQGQLHVLQPGTHTVPPFFGEVVIYPLTDQVYTMTGQIGAGNAVVGNDAVEARSKDGHQLWLDVAVTFHFVESKLPDVHKVWHSPQMFVNGLIRPTTRNAVYNTAYQFDYEEIVSAKRSEVEAAISQQLTEIFGAQGAELVKFKLLDVRDQ